MNDICNGNEMVETAANLLRESLPASLKEIIREAIAAGATKKDIIERVLRLNGGQRTLTVLAIEEFFNSEC
jgi:hypothetical protein